MSGVLWIRRPLEEGPPGCEDFLDPLYLTSVCDGIILQPWIFWIFIFWILSKGQSLISHVSCLVSQVSWTVYCPPEKNQSPSTRRWLRIRGDPKITMKIHQFSSRSPMQQKPWKLVPRPPKIMKKWPWNHKKSNLCESWFLQYLPCQMLVFASPDTQI